MAKTTQCDVCEQAINISAGCWYERRANWTRWFNWTFGPVPNNLDVCEDCWKGFQEFMKSKVKEDK